jgi:hypothetical protein
VPIQFAGQADVAVGDGPAGHPAGQPVEYVVPIQFAGQPGAGAQPAPPQPPPPLTGGAGAGTGVPDVTVE